MEAINTIKRRYIHERAIYTWCGIALVAVNPYQEQDIYGDQVVETYHSASHSVYLQLDPHIYAVTEAAYSKLELNSRNQSIIVSGESGAGKTVSAKHAMRYLASIAGQLSSSSSSGSANNNNNHRGASLRIENRVLASNPIMEAIGNASTVRNDNSSRFGKYIQIYFDQHARRILGANMRTYLLEKSRVTSQQVGERNFHIFYQLLNYAHKNPHQMADLKLINLDTHQMHSFGFLAGVKPHEKRDDLRRFQEALRTLNIDEQRVSVIYRIIAGILHGGNIKFKPQMSDSDDDDDDIDSRPCTIDESEFHFNACCELLGLEPEVLRQRLTVKLLRSGARDIIEQPQTCQKAEYCRDAILKYIYECLFAWLVALINLSLSSREAALEVQRQQQQHAIPKSPSAKAKSILDQQPLLEPQFIGVLDIYGFENFKTNSFEQFCINYANEVLQQQYNQHVFKIEQEEYIREGIDWTFIEYSDNQPVIDIIESRPIGILNLLDEECKMPKGSDTTWCAKLYDQLLPNDVNKNATTKKKRKDNDDKEENSLMPTAAGAARFKKPKLNYQESFVVCHYAEEVSYNVLSFLEKNRDTLAEDQCDMLRRSEALAFLFEDPLLGPETRPKMRTSRSATVGWQFRCSLAALIKTLNATEPHYVRCIKPNDEKKAFEFNEERAIQQLKACGVYETIRISNNGFPSRWHYKDFAKRYCVLIYGTHVFTELARASQARRKQQQQQQIQNVAIVDSNSTTIDHQDNQENHQIITKDYNQNETSAPTATVAPTPTRHFMCQFTSADVRPICEAICKSAYDNNSQYSNLRTEEEQNYLDQLRERHGQKPSAIYQFGKTKIFFRAAQVGYLERVRGQKLRGYTLTIQRHVRGWLARRSFRVRREQYYEELRREASILSLQNQVNSLQTELEQTKLDQERQQQEEEEVEEETCRLLLSRSGSMYGLIVDMMYTAIQPLIIGSVLEYEALDPPADPFASLELQANGGGGGSRSQTPSDSTGNEQPSMECLIRELNQFYDLTRKNLLPDDIIVQVFKQLFYLICAHSLNQLLIRRDLCQFRKAMQINFNLSCLVQWCREHFLVNNWRDIVAQLDPITQATKLLQTRKSSDDIATIEEVCNKLRPSQIIKILNMYTSTYEEQISTEFIHELEAYLNETRHHKDKLIENCTANMDLLLMDTKHFFPFEELEVSRSRESLASPS